jgi:hypothetical protein
LLERPREVFARSERDARERVLRELKLGAPKAEVREVARRSERAVLDSRIVRCLEIAEERDSRSFSCVVLCFM